MGAFNFRKRYAEPIASGVKCSTIRPPRKNGWLPRPGEILALYWGMRTKHCTLIRRVVCEAVEPVALTMGALPGEITVKIKDRDLPRDELERFAVGEGFADPVDMAEFFRGFYGSYMAGWLIRWKPLPASLPEERKEDAS